jgi:hypothetical protein
VQFSGRDETGPVEIRAVAEPVRAAPAREPVRLADNRTAATGAAPVVPGQPGAPAAEHDDGSGDVRQAREAPRSRHASRWRAGGPAGHAPFPAAPESIAAGMAAANRAPASGTYDRLQWSVDAVNAAGQLIASWRGVRLRDAGPLPRNAAWPPALLAAFLERSASDLGLDDGLRVTVSYGQPAVPAGAIPRQSGPDHGEHAGGDPRAAGQVPTRRSRLRPARAAAAGPLAGFTFAVQAPVPAACGWTAIDEASRQHQPATGLAIAYGQLRAELNEPAPLLAGRLEAIRGCLATVGTHADSDLRVVQAASDDWVVLATRRARIACTVVELSGVAAPVAVALLTMRGSHARPAPTRPATSVGS